MMQDLRLSGCVHYEMTTIMFLFTRTYLCHQAATAVLLPVVGAAPFNIHLTFNVSASPS